MASACSIEEIEGTGPGVWGWKYPPVVPTYTIASLPACFRQLVTNSNEGSIAFWWPYFGVDGKKRSRAATTMATTMMSVKAIWALGIYPMILPTILFKHNQIATFLWGSATDTGMVKIIHVSSQKAVQTAVKVLKRGGVIVFPTETSYGLGADAGNKKAIKKVFKLKRMIPSRKISVMVADKSMVHRWFGKDKKVDALIDAFLPGPLTIITKGNSFRIPDYNFCLQVVKKLARPVTSTSCNISGGSDHYSIKPILKELKGVDVIIDGGSLPKRRPSTVYDVDKRVIIRKGAISELEIKKVLYNLRDAAMKN